MSKFEIISEKKKVYNITLNWSYLFVCLSTNLWGDKTLRSVQIWFLICTKNDHYLMQATCSYLLKNVNVDKHMYLCICEIFQRHQPQSPAALAFCCSTSCSKLWRSKQVLKPKTRNEAQRYSMRALVLVLVEFQSMSVVVLVEDQSTSRLP